MTRGRDDRDRGRGTISYAMVGKSLPEAYLSAFPFPFLRIAAAFIDLTSRQ